MDNESDGMRRAPRARTTTMSDRQPELSHVDPVGGVRMVNVGAKPLSRRRAVARATVRMAPETAARLRALPKGDALATAQLAGIMAAKRTSDLIPLCHPLPLSAVDVRLEVGERAVEIEGIAETTAQTGVEMEALVAVSVAALTVYDMAKAIDGQMSVTDVVLIEKTKDVV
jgi:cyclic pyranopterin phosphate synthase